jgi:dTDP-4-amino-4,6-dideoxygalactose transaminase
MMGVPFLDLKSEYRSLKTEIDAAVQDVLASGYYVLGEKVEKFEEQFARYIGVKYAVAVNSGTSAVFLALRAQGIGADDEVITQANTFVATCEAIAMTGATPRLVDVHPDSRNMDPSLISEAISSKSRAIMPVHLYGLPANMEGILEVAREAGLPVVEDAAQAHGAECEVSDLKARVGSLGSMGAFSFYPSKNLGCYGEGGAVVTNDRELYERVVMLRDHGQKGKHAHVEIGGNYRMSAFQGAILGVKLAKLDQFNQMRIELARTYDEILSRTGVVLPKSGDGTKHVYHLYVIEAPGRDSLRERLAGEKIGTGIHYPYPVHLCPAFEYLGYEEGDFPVSEALCRRILSLPMYPQLSSEDARYVARKVVGFLE